MLRQSWAPATCFCLLQLLTKCGRLLETIEAAMLKGLLFWLGFFVVLKPETRCLQADSGA